MNMTDSEIKEFESLCDSEYTEQKYNRYCELYSKKIKHDYLESTRKNKNN